MFKIFSPILSELQKLFLFLKSLNFYLSKKIADFARTFEEGKDFLVDKLLWRRGVLHRPVVHSSFLTLSVVALVSGGILGVPGLVSGSYPGVPENQNQILPSNPEVLGVTLVQTTQISEKPRDKIIEYEVQSGDTVSKIAQNFGISADTIRWANNLEDADEIFPGDKLKILPVSGIAHSVRSGDTIYSVADKYKASAQAILDFPFNDIADDLALKVGQTVIVPDGVPPQKPRPVAPQYFASVESRPAPVTGGGAFIWPVGGPITQYFSWYHQGIDIGGGNFTPPIAASDGGTVVVAGWPDNFGFGNRIMIDHGNGYMTQYAHLSRIYVRVGEKVSRGQIIGQMGSTGRSTGNHLDFRIFKNSVVLNPLTILK